VKAYKGIIFILGLIYLNAAMALQWPNNAKSAVSVSADDGWPTQLDQASILEKYGFRGTFYLSAGGMPAVITYKDAWRGVFQRGHEVGNHSYSHWADPVLAGKTWQEVAIDVGNMEQWLLANIYSLTPSDHTFAYPGGNYIIGSQDSLVSRQVGSCEYAAFLSAIVTGARIAGSGENDPNKVPNQRYWINGVPIDGDDTTAFNNAKQAIDNGIKNNTWTILIFHALGDGSGLTVTKAGYTKIISYLQSRQTDLWVAPVIKVKNYIMSNIPYSPWSCPPVE
jgi:peptidoglycan/xylan/chitin deacetylase (PgdA/CDA1 family)